MDLEKHETPLLLLLYEKSWSDREVQYVGGMQHVYKGSRKTVRCAIRANKTV